MVLVRAPLVGQIDGFYFFGSDIALSLECSLLLGNIGCWCSDYSKFDVYYEAEVINYPTKDRFYIHPNLDGNDFCELKDGDPLFINANNETILYKNDNYDVVYPIFVNEAAYLEKNVAIRK